MHTWKVWFSVVNILDIHFQGVNAQFTYELSDDAEGLFEINPSTGIIRVARGGQVLDRETNSRFTLTVCALRIPLLLPTNQTCTNNALL